MVPYSLEMAEFKNTSAAHACAYASQMVPIKKSRKFDANVDWPDQKQNDSFVSKTHSLQYIHTLSEEDVATHHGLLLPMMTALMECINDNKSIWESQCLFWKNGHRSLAGHITKLSSVVKGHYLDFVRVAGRRREVSSILQRPYPAGYVLWRIQDTSPHLPTTLAYNCSAYL